MALITVDDITSRRVHVRAVRESDLADLLQVNGDPEVTRFLPYATWTSLDDAAAWLARMTSLGASGTSQQLAVVHNADAVVIGTVLLFRFDEASARVELGYVLGRRWWGQGLMREALSALCTHAFTAMGIRRMEAEVHAGNGASQALLQRLGFVREGILRARWVSRGTAYDTHLYGCLATEWTATGA